MTLVRVVGAAIAFALGMLIGLGGCASSGGAPEPLSFPGTEIDLGSPGEPVATYEDVQFYPACGNEVLTYDGKTWFPFTPKNTAGYPTDPLVEAAAVVSYSPVPAVAAGPVGAVVAPGPGDDVGTLIAYEGGFAYWVSDSGDLDTWLTTTELAYNWVC
jgi:hypothetical protein